MERKRPPGSCLSEEHLDLQDWTTYICYKVSTNEFFRSWSKNFPPADNSDHFKPSSFVFLLDQPKILHEILERQKNLHQKGNNLIVFFLLPMYKTLSFLLNFIFCHLKETNGINFIQISKGKYIIQIQINQAQIRLILTAKPTRVYCNEGELTSSKMTTPILTSIFTPCNEQEI